MTSAQPSWTASEIVPIADRLRYMRLFRIAAAVLIVAFSNLVSDPSDDVEKLTAITPAYVVIALLSDLAWRRSRRVGVFVFGGMLMIDGVYLAWASYVTGGDVSPVRHVVVLHLITVVLLASYRTGLKLAMWHSLLLFVIYYAKQTGLLQPIEISAQLPGTGFQRLMAFVIVFWLVTISTSAFSAVNERELRRRRYDVEALANMATDLEKTAGPFDVAEVLINHVVDAFGFKRAVVLGSRSDDLSLMAYRGPDRAVGSQSRLKPESVILATQKSQQTLLVSELDPDSDRWLAALLPDSQNLVLVPLLGEGTSVGILVVEHGMKSGSRMEKRAISMVERFASHAALALRGAWLLEQVQRMAATDGLTGIGNRRTFDNAIQRDVTKSIRNHEQLSLIIMDIDHFKNLNDTHGHQAGDAVLREVAQLLASNCREFDTVARYGGEEFCLILPSCPPVQALAIAERCRQLVEESETTVPVTISAGVATYPINATDVASLIKAADGALYESKRAGRNRVTWSRENIDQTQSVAATSGGPT